MSRLLFLLILLTSVPCATAQDNPPADRAPEPGQPSSPEAGNGPQTPPDADQKPAPDSGEDPFDYEASEQISEDLSVSFPVDI